MIARLLYLVLLFLGVRLLWRSLVERFQMEVRPRTDGDRRRGSEEAPAVYKGLMVRDPQCGVYLPENRSLSEGSGGERIHFCSPACRTAYHRAQEEARERATARTGTG
jgi:hypothetical protein